MQMLDSIAHFGALGVFPETGVVRTQFFFFELDGLPIDVKDTPSAPARAQIRLVIGLM